MPKHASPHPDYYVDVTLDGVTGYLAHHLDDVTWNGFVIPWFSAVELMALAAAEVHNGIFIAHNTKPFSTEPRFALIHDDGFTPLDVTVIDGCRYYQFPTGFVWEPLKKKEPRHA